MESDLSSNSGLRSVTPEEIDHLQRLGWVTLKKFIPVDLINRALALGKEKMGEDGDRNAPPKFFTYFNSRTTQGLGSPVLAPIIAQCGVNAALLMARKARVGVRYFSDYFNIKLPAKTKSDHGGNGATPWHQDFAAAGSDRSGTLLFWIALEDIPPEKGTMSFLSGSHRFGAMGHFSTYGKGNLLDAYPELLDHCAPTAFQAYAPGDVSVHTNMTVHSAGLNLTDRPRWTYTVMASPADACWNGGAVDAFETKGLVQYREFDSERFPIIG